MTNLNRKMSIIQRNLLYKTKRYTYKKTEGGGVLKTARTYRYKKIFMFMT
jgi:hypothetical protein